MTQPGSKGFLEERAIPQLPEALPAIEVRTLLPTATEAGLLNKGVGISIDANLPRGTFWQFTPKGIETARAKIRESQNQASSTPVNFSLFCTYLLVAMADYTDRQARGEFRRRALELAEIAKAYELAFSPGWIRRASEVFADKSWASIEYTLSNSEDDGVHVTLNGIGFLEAERLKGLLSTNDIKIPKFSIKENSDPTVLETKPSAGMTLGFVDGSNEVNLPSSEGFVPASDRIVRLDDNAPGRLEAIENLDKIEKLLESGNNELKLTADERMVIVSEIKPLRERLLTKHVRVGEVCNAVTKGSPLVWLLDKVAGHAVGIVIGTALAALGLLAKALIG